MSTNLDASGIEALSESDYQKAYIEVAFLLDAFATTIDNIMGGNIAPVGRIAGRDTAAKLPLSLDKPDFEKVIAALGEHLAAGFEFSQKDKGFVFDKCIIRQMCELRGIKPGGALCALFHAYFDGIANGLLSRPVKSVITKAGKSCQIEIKTK